MPLNTASKNAALKSGAGGGIVGGITHIGVATDDAVPGQGADFAGVEPVAAVYSRAMPTWGDADAEQVTHTNPVSVTVPAGTYAYWTLWAGQTGTGGGYRGYVPFAGTRKGFATVAADTTPTDTIQSAGHALDDGDRVLIFGVYAEALPGGLSETVLYYVTESTADTFKVSASAGGTAIDVTTPGELAWQDVTPHSFPGTGTITAAPGGIVIDASTL